MYVITRAVREGKPLTTAQRSSALFSPEPVVLGRTLRRGSRPLRLTEADFKANEAQLLRLERAGSICIQKPEPPPVPEDPQKKDPSGNPEPKKNDPPPDPGQGKKTEEVPPPAETSGAGDAPPQQEGTEEVLETQAASVPPAAEVPQSEAEIPQLGDPAPAAPVQPEAAQGKSKKRKG